MKLKIVALLALGIIFANVALAHENYHRDAYGPTRDELRHERRYLHHHSYDRHHEGRHYRGGCCWEE